MWKKIIFHLIENVDEDEIGSDLVDSHLLQCECEALLHLQPVVGLLAEHLAGHQGSVGYHLVLLITNYFRYEYFIHLLEFLVAVGGGTSGYSHSQ